jgi:hypothetical protein
MGANVAFLEFERELSADWIDLSLISSPESQPESRTGMMKFVPEPVCNGFSLMSNP